MGGGKIEDKVIIGEDGTSGQSGYIGLFLHVSVGTFWCSKEAVIMYW